MKICYVDHNEEQIGLTKKYHMDKSIGTGSRILHDVEGVERAFYVVKIEIDEHYLIIQITPECL